MHLFILFCMLSFSSSLFCFNLIDLMTNGGITSLERGPRIIGNKKLLQFEQKFDLYVGKDIAELISKLEISYGFSEQFAMQFRIPAILMLKEPNFNERCFGDIFVLINWYFFRTKEVIASLSSGLKLPTASKNIGGYNASQSLDIPVEFQAIFNFEHWYAEADIDALIKVKSRKKIKFGNFYTLELALGRRYEWHEPNYFKNLFLVGRLTGEHARFNFIKDIRDDNSGGTIFLFGPDITLGAKSIVMRTLLQFPILNRPFGIQNTIDFRAFFSLKILI